MNDSLLLFADATLCAAEHGNTLPRFEVLAYTGGPLKVDAFDLPVVVDLSKLEYGNSIVANLDHNREHRVGHVPDWVNDGKTLRMSVLASAETSHRDEVVKSARNGFRWQTSIETREMKLRTIAPGKSEQINGQTIHGPVYVTTRAKLKGVAFVTHGADDNSSARLAAAAAQQREVKNMDPKFSDWLKGKNWDPDGLDAGQTATLTAAWKRENGTPAEDQDTTLDAAIARQTAERKRESDITRLMEAQAKRFPRHAEELQAMARKAVDEGTSSRDYEISALRTVQTQLSDFRERSTDRPDGRVLSAALCMAGGLDKPERYFDEHTLEAADQQYRGGLGIQELVLMAAQQNGYRGRASVRANLEEVLRYAFPPRGRDGLDASGGFSTISLPTVFSNSMNKFNVEAFNAVESEWKKICYTRPVSDLKEISSFSLTGDLTYEQIGPTGEIPHGTLRETTYGNKAKTFAKMLALTREHLLNDDSGALNAISRRLGRGGALKINLEFWAEFLNNATFYTAERGNFDDGTDSAFDEAGLAAADLLFRALLDPDGNPLGALAKYLVVPPSKRIAALKLMRSQTVNAADNSGTDNAWAGQFEVVSSQYMVNSNLTGYSTKKWYLLADPNDIPVIEGVFLNGQMMPIIESADADFDVLGIQIRAIHDWGFRKQEHRGGVAMKGEN